MKRSTWMVCIAGLLAAGCGGDAPTGTRNVSPLTVTISGGGSMIGRTTLINSQTYYACQFNFAVAVDGGASLDDAFWTDASIDYRLNATGALSSQIALSTDLQDWFGIDRLLPGARLSAVRTLAWSGPFTATVTFRYSIYRFPSVLGESYSVPIPVSCS